jgi:polysaccharide chain length determinant protein (PEP-CTERM system associated)
MVAETAHTENRQSVLLEPLVTIRNRKWLALAVTWIVCVVGWTGVMLVPQNYESDARAFVDVNGLLAPLLKGLVVDTTPEQSENYLQRTLLSVPNLEQVIVLSNLGGSSLTDLQRQELVAALATEIKVTTQGKNLFSISYSNTHPVVAKNVVDALLTVFAEKAANSSRAEMDKARAFLSEQIAAYEIQLRAAEQRRADFKKKFAIYFDQSGVKQPELLQNVVAQARQQYDEELAKRTALQAQIAEIPQLLNVGGGATVGANGQIVAASPGVRLALARRRLSELKLVYTDKHPDVIAAQQAVKELGDELAAAKKNGTSNEGKSEISNPVFEQLRLKLADSQAQIPVLKQRLDRAVSDYNSIKALGGDLPEIAAKSQDMDRDYDIIKKNYDELVKRREAANLSQAADDRADRTQFRVVDPPQVPIYPAFPDRVLLFSVVLALGIGAGVAAPIVLAQLKPTFGSVARLRDLGLPVIGAITSVRGLRPVGGFGSAASSLFASAGAGLVLVYGGLLVTLTGILKGIW